MKQAYIFRFSAFILIMVLHMYFYDPSFMKFIGNFKEIFELNFNDRFLLNSVIWLLGFWGIVLFLNSEKHVVRFSCWIIFILAAFMEFAYGAVLKEAISIENIDKAKIVFEKIPTIASMEFMKFVALTIFVVSIAIVLKPLSLTITKTFLVVLFTSIVLLFLAHKGKNIVLPSFYLVPAMFAYKYLMLAYHSFTASAAASTSKAN